MALMEQLREDQVSVPAPENLYVVKLGSLPTINCYGMLRGLKLGDGKSLPCVLG